MTTDKKKAFDALSAQDQVSAWLEMDGFKVEAEVAKVLHDDGFFSVHQSLNYFDGEDEVVRESDIFAKKTWNFREALEGTAFESRLMYQRDNNDWGRLVRSYFEFGLFIECKYAQYPWVLFSDLNSQTWTHDRPVIESHSSSTIFGQSFLWDAFKPMLVGREAFGQALRPVRNTSSEKRDSNDNCFKAVMSVVKGASYEAHMRQDESAALVTCKTLLPTIVLKGKLFQARKDEQFHLQTRPIDWGLLTYQIPGPQERTIHIDVVTYAGLSKLIDAAKGVYQSLQPKFRKNVDFHFRKLLDEEEENVKRYRSQGE